jgi:hypothetical protein
MPLAGDPGHDAASAQGAALLRVVVALVAMQLVGSEAGTSGLARRAEDGRDRVDRSLQVRAVVGIGRGELGGERDAATIHD